ncbi:hypothetical protein T492DRAFT_933115 [Pavlovales sp. CCMP2436]|nr:hypothetical protein T492DRAFT_933115 [Pavlovales sp. CCMP2436]
MAKPPQAPGKRPAKRPHPGPAATRTPRLCCAVCRSEWPAELGSLDTHLRGRRHKENVLSDAFYGEPGHALTKLGFDEVDGPIRALPAALAERARGIWSLISGSPAALVSLAGIDRYQRVLDLLAPERLACAAVRLSLEAGEAADRSSWRCDLRSPAGVAYVACVLERRLSPAALDGRGALPSGAGELALAELTLGWPREYNSAGNGSAGRSAERYFAFAHACALIGRALCSSGCVAHTVRIRVRSDGKCPGALEGMGRVAQRLVSTIGMALGTPTGLRHARRVELLLPPPLLRPEMQKLLDEANAASFDARVLALLLGTHARAGAESPLRMLPQVVLEILCVQLRSSVLVSGWVEDDAPPPVHISYDPGAQRFTFQPRQAPSTGHASAEMAHLIDLAIMNGI